MVKKILHAFFMCFSMFSAIPFPCHTWDEDARYLMMLFLPFVGLLHGFLWTVSAIFLRHFSTAPLLASVLLAAFPFLITGYIHLDGYMDVIDSIKSYKSKEERIKILKDSHCGSFAVISVVILFSLQLASCFAIYEKGNFLPLTFIPAVSRILSSICVTSLPTLATSQYSNYNSAKHKKMQAFILLAMCFTLFLIAYATCGKDTISLVGVVLAYLLALRRAFTSLGGMSGDVSGYSITISEAFGLLVLVLVG